jgi:UDP-N-acetylglucosamine 2-epimerase
VTDLSIRMQLKPPPDYGRGNTPGILMSKRVLFLPHIFRHKYFLDFIEAAVKTRSWIVGVIGAPDARKSFSSVVTSPEQYFLTPEFSIPDAWEHDESERTRINALISKCERKTGISANRVLLAGERDIGRAYSREFYYWNEGRMARRVLNDPTENQRILARMFHFVDRVLTEFWPDLIISGNTSKSLYFVCSMVAEERGIPFILNRRSKIHSARCYWTTNRNMLSDLSQQEYLRRQTVNEPVSENARAYLKRFRDTPETVKYIRDHWKNSAALKLWGRWHLQAAALAFSQLANFVRRRRGQRPLSAWLHFTEYYRMAYLRVRHNLLVSKLSEEELQKMKYIYLPLHKEPEMAINTQAYPWHSQKNTIKFISSLLPYGCRLLVREHRGVWGRRPTAFYKYLRRLPGVTLIDPFDSQFKYVRNAALVVTENGSTGWEGLLYRRPVITLHENFYHITGLTNAVSVLVDLNAKIVELASGDVPFDAEDYDRRLGWLLDAEWDVTLPDDNQHQEESQEFIERLLEPNAPLPVKSVTNERVA